MKIKDTDHHFLNSILSITGEAIYLITSEAAFQYVNDAACRMTGYSKDELLSMHVSDVNPFCTPEKYKELWKVFKENKIVTFETGHRRKDGSEFPVEVNTRYFEYGEEEYICSIVRDATVYKESDRKLRESEQRLRAIMDNSKMVIFMKDLKGRYILANNWYKLNMGLDEKDLLGKTSHDIFPKDIADALRTDDLKIIESKSMIEFENILFLGNEEHIFQTLKFPLIDESGNPYAVCGMSTDITEKKRLEEMKEKLQAQLLHSQKMEAVGVLAGGIAHDFNNILTAIRNFSYIGMKRYQEPATPASDIFENIRNASDRAANLTRQLLTFSQREPENLTILDMNDLINNLMEMLTAVIGKDIHIQRVLDTELWKTMGDRGKMEQVIMNLVVNSRNAMPQGGTITIMTENASFNKENCNELTRLRPGRFVHLTVKDTGTGISKEHIKHIFEPFFTTKKDGTSSGLGLSVVYGIIEDYKGSITVESEEGKGATFDVYLPVADRGLEKEKKDMVSVSELKGSGERILLVEDDKFVRISTGMFLVDEGYIIVDAENALEALDIYKKEEGRFSLVISDFILPDRNGLQLIEELRSFNPHLKTILISGFMANNKNLSEIEESKVIFLRKPFDIDVLLRVIKDVLRPV